MASNNSNGNENSSSLLKSTTNYPIMKTLPGASWVLGHNTKTHTYHLSLSFQNQPQQQHQASASSTANFGSHAPGIKKAMQILETQFGGGSSSQSQYQLQSQMTIGNPTHTADVVDATDNGVVNINNKNKIKNMYKDVDDGRIHSLPGKKHGPYTCSKCKAVLPTSQKFANHVSYSHYRHESKEDKNKRYMAKIQKRSRLQIHKLDKKRITVRAASASVKSRAFETGGSIHTGGCVSSGTQRVRLREELGRDSILDEVQMRIQQNEETNQVTNEQYRQWHEIFSMRMTEYSEIQNNLPPVLQATPEEWQQYADNVWKEVCGSRVHETGTSSSHHKRSRNEVKLEPEN